ncbi:MAG TPA: hypothetical protein VGM92_15820, partial [Candidatus Kapabacteria bacterium]
MQKTLELRSFPKILVTADVCIGDAVLISESVRAIRDEFPLAEIHYVCNRTGGQLVEGMPDVQVHNIIQGERGFPTKDDLARLRALVEREQFHAILNLGPFFSKRAIGTSVPVLQLFVPLAASVLRAWNSNGPRHLSYIARQFMADFFSTRSIGLESKLNTNSVYLSEEAV